MFERLMKRRTFLTSSGAASFGLAGCLRMGSNDSGESSANESGSQTNTATESSYNIDNQVGDTVAVQTGIELSLQNAQVAKKVTFSDEEVYEAPDGKLFALLQIQSTNTADTVLELPTTEEIVLTTDSNQYSSSDIYDEFGSTPPLTNPIEGEKYEEVTEARSGVSTSGWIGFIVPDNITTARVSWARDTYTNDGSERLVAEWEVTFEPEAVPDLAVTSIDAPSSTERYQEIMLSITVENTGGRSGQFNGEVTAESLEQPIPVMGSVSGNSTKTFTPTVSYPVSAGHDAVSEVTYSIGSKSATVNYTIPERSFTEGYVSPSGVKTTIEDLQLADTVTSGNQYSSLESEPNTQYAVIKVKSVATNDSSDVAGSGDIYVRVAGERYSSESFFFTATSPIAGDSLGSSYGDSDTNSGLVACEIPASVQKDDIEVIWDQGPGVVDGWDVDVVFTPG